MFNLTPTRALALFLRWLLLAFAVWAAAAILPGIHLSGWESTLAVALILGLLNMYLKPILFLLSLPATVLTLGLFVILINAALLGLTSWIAGGFDSIHFHVDSVWSAIFGAIIISVVTVLSSIVVRPERLARELTGGY